MSPRELIEILNTAEKLKDTTRHCYTSNGRQESVAEHTWMIVFMAFLLSEEFPDVDMNKVLKMCIIHDLGECFTGDIPTFDKTLANSETEEILLKKWVDTLPLSTSQKMSELYIEMEEMESTEAKIYKAFDSLEALIQHNLSDLSTWSENEKTFNLTYADERVVFSRFLSELREEIRKDTILPLFSQYARTFLRKSNEYAIRTLYRKYPVFTFYYSTKKAFNNRPHKQIYEVKKP